MGEKNRPDISEGKKQLVSYFRRQESSGNILGAFYRQLPMENKGKMFWEGKVKLLLEIWHELNYIEIFSWEHIFADGTL